MKTFVCDGCGEDKPLPAKMLGEHVDGEVYRFCDEDCACDWIGGAIELAYTSQEEINNEKVSAKAQARRNAKRN
jgi:hypothetical protein